MMQQPRRLVTMRERRERDYFNEEIYILDFKVPQALPARPSCNYRLKRSKERS
jgi:hypothetical protein